MEDFIMKLMANMPVVAILGAILWFGRKDYKETINHLRRENEAKDDALDRGYRMLEQLRTTLEILKDRLPR